MNTFTRNRINSTQTDSFLDTCTIDTYSSGSNSYGELLKTWISGSPISCGYKSNVGNKTYGETEIRLQYSAIFRIPEHSVISTNDKITLTKISGSSISPIQYQVASISAGHGIKTIGASNSEV